MRQQRVAEEVLDTHPSLLHGAPDRSASRAEDFRLHRRWEVNRVEQPPEQGQLLDGDKCRRAG
jgi:hypothetical protein